MATDTRPWRKSSRSGTQGSCVEVAPTPAGAHIRDTKDRAGGELYASPGEWRAFLAMVARP